MYLAWALSFFLLSGGTVAQALQGPEEAKRAALEATEVLLRFSENRPFHWPDRNGCDLSSRHIYAGKPILVRSLTQPTRADLARLRRRIEAAKQQEPDFVGDLDGEVRFAQLNYSNTYEVPVYHRTCGYMFHVQAKDKDRDGFSYGQFLPIGADEAQVLLGVAKVPTLVSFESLTPQYDGYLWLAGHYAVDAFRNNRRYRIVGVRHQPVDLLNTDLKLQIFAERFVTSYSQPSAYWHFRLPVRLVPESLSNP